MGKFARLFLHIAMMIVGTTLAGLGYAGDKDEPNVGGGLGDGLSEVGAGLQHLVTSVATSVADSAQTAGDWVTRHLGKAETTVETTGGKVDKTVQAATKATTRGVSKALNGAGSALDRLAGKLQGAARKVESKD